jgi:hypothetical protein
MHVCRLKTLQLRRRNHLQLILMDQQLNRLPAGTSNMHPASIKRNNPRSVASHSCLDVQNLSLSSAITPCDQSYPGHYQNWSPFQYTLACSVMLSCSCRMGYMIHDTCQRAASPQLPSIAITQRQGPRYLPGPSRSSCHIRVCLSAPSRRSRGQTWNINLSVFLSVSATSNYDMSIVLSMPKNGVTLDLKS